MTDPTEPQPPIPAELFHAYPLGSLSFLAGAASVISAEHGVDAAHDLFALLTSSESFWAELRARFEPVVDPALLGETGPAAAPAGTNGTV